MTNLVLVLEGNTEGHISAAPGARLADGLKEPRSDDIGGQPQPHFQPGTGGPEGHQGLAARKRGRDAIHCTALGRAIAAAMPDSAVSELVGVHFDRRTEHTIVRWSDLKTDLQQIRKQNGGASGQREPERAVTGIHVQAGNSRGANERQSIGAYGPQARPRGSLCRIDFAREARVQFAKRRGERRDALRAHAQILAREFRSTGNAHTLPQWRDDDVPHAINNGTRLNKRRMARMVTARGRARQRSVA